MNFYFLQSSFYSMPEIIFCFWQLQKMTTFDNNELFIACHVKKIK
jgi:hypothetical protein